jgi:hypothetical protein
MTPSKIIFGGAAATFYNELEFCLSIYTPLIIANNTLMLIKLKHIDGNVPRGVVVLFLEVSIYNI